MQGFLFLFQIFFYYFVFQVREFTPDSFYQILYSHERLFNHRCDCYRCTYCLFRFHSEPFENFRVRSRLRTHLVSP